LPHQVEVTLAISNFYWKRLQ